MQRQRDGEPGLVEDEGKSEGDARNCRGGVETERQAVRPFFPSPIQYAYRRDGECRRSGGGERPQGIGGDDVDLRIGAGEDHD